MNQLEQSVFKEELNKLKEYASKVSISAVKTVYGEHVLKMSEAEIEKSAVNTWNETSRLRFNIEGCIEKLELVLDSLTSK